MLCQGLTGSSRGTRSWLGPAAAGRAAKRTHAAPSAMGQHLTRCSGGDAHHVLLCKMCFAGGPLHGLSGAAGFLRAVPGGAGGALQPGAREVGACSNASHGALPKGGGSCQECDAVLSGLQAGKRHQRHSALGRMLGAQGQRPPAWPLGGRAGEEALASPWAAPCIIQQDVLMLLQDPGAEQLLCLACELAAGFSAGLSPTTVCGLPDVKRHCPTLLAKTLTRLWGLHSRTALEGVRPWTCRMLSASS